MTVSLSTHLDQGVLSVIRDHRGRGNAITARRIGEILHIDQRSPWGFYLPANRSEAEECSRHLWSRVREIAEVARAFDEAARGLGVRRVKAEQARMVFGEGQEVG